MGRVWSEALGIQGVGHACEHSPGYVADYHGSQPALNLAMWCVIKAGKRCLDRF